VPRLVAAPDKLRGTATAREAADAIAEGARRAGWAADRVALSDGGEGLLDVLGGEHRTMRVTGPLGVPVDARWSLLEDGTAVVESAEAAGRALVPAPRGDDPVRASTYGVGELLVAALAAGPRRVLVGCGGSATTDGGEGCLAAVTAAGIVFDVPVVVACDVDTAFLDAPPVFGPQKGATPDQVRALTERLSALAAEYRRRFGVDVTEVRGAGAAGGLAGGLVALGATAAPGAALVAGRVALDARLEGADLVVTAEGRVDRGTLGGKVVAEVLARRGDLPALVLAGSIDAVAAEALAARRTGPVRWRTLDGAHQARAGTPAALADAVAAALADGDYASSRQPR
jgi:glycerate 2-kinase